MIDTGCAKGCWRRQWQPTPVLLPGKSHRWRSLVGCSSWGRKESDMTERLHFHFSLSCIGEGNGNPLQCSCLENPGMGSLVGCRLWGRTESDTTEADLAAAAAAKVAGDRAMTVHCCQTVGIKIPNKEVQAM